MSERTRQLLPPGILLVVVALLSVFYCIGPKPAFDMTMQSWLIFYDDPPFADAKGVAGAIECERLGYETYIENPCEPKLRPFVYTPFWKLATALPVTRAWTPALVVVWAGLFFLSLFTLPAAPGRRGVVFMTAAMLSPSTLMAIEYGNNEMLIFAFAVGGTLLLARSWVSRVAAYALFMLAGLLKYFPAVLLAFALRERPRRFFAIAMVTTSIASLFAILAREQLALSMGALGTMSPISYVFGLPNVRVLVVAMGQPLQFAQFMHYSLMTTIIVVAALLSRRDWLVKRVQELSQRHRDFLLVGAMLSVAAYLMSQNVAYRQIYLLMVLPGLMVMGEGNVPARFRLLPWLIVLEMCIFPLRVYSRAMFEEGSAAHGFTTMMGVLVRDVGWMALATVLLAIIFAAFTDTPVVRDLLGRLRKS